MFAGYLHVHFNLCTNNLTEEVLVVDSKDLKVLFLNPIQWWRPLKTINSNLQKIQCNGTLNIQKRGHNLEENFTLTMIKM